MGSRRLIICLGVDDLSTLLVTRMHVSESETVGVEMLRGGMENGFVREPWTFKRLFSRILWYGLVFDNGCIIFSVLSHWN